MTDPPRSTIASTASPSATPSTGSPSSSSKQPPQKKRRNTIEEKRRMRNLRKKRMRKRGKQLFKDKVANLKKELNTAKKDVAEGEHRISVLRSMSRTYWERWRWELEKRKEAMIGSPRASQTKYALVHEIDPTLLVNPIVNGKPKEHYLGRGSFGVVRLQLYRGIHVAVKELLPRSVKEDAKHEAEILASLCHPFLPLLFGVCTQARPLRIIMQFHGFIKHSALSCSLTLHQEIQQQSLVRSGTEWLNVCAQILEAISYLHNKVKVIHNDIKGDNILIGPSNSATLGDFQIVIVDFGKATIISEGKKYNLSPIEIMEYRQKYPHIAPEVLEGETKQSIYSDMFSVGGVFYKIIDNGCLLHHDDLRKKLVCLAEQCRLVHFNRRYSASKALSFVQETLL